jgi:trehalose/maltose hydrolase-like predicted phosphorylase
MFRALVSGIAVSVLLLPASGETALAAAPAAPAAPDGSSGWSMSTSDPFQDYHPAFTGNGYLGVRVPGVGQGFATQPVMPQSQVAGFYAEPSGDVARKASLPAWSGLDLVRGADRFSAALDVPCRFGHVCQAEFGELAGRARGTTEQPGYTGTGFVAGYGDGNDPVPGTATSWRVRDVATAGAMRLTVRYANGAAPDGSHPARTLGLIVGGRRASTLTLPPTKDFTTWDTTSTSVRLPAGDNTVALRCDPGDSCMVNLDWIALTPPDAPAPAPDPLRLEDTPLRAYDQTLDLRTGTITTAARWNGTPVSYEVFTDRARPHVGVVRLRFTPTWSGTARVQDVIDQRAATWSDPPQVSRSGQQTTYQTSAQGSGVRAAVVSRVSGPENVQVTAGRTVTIDKYVGVATSQDPGSSGDPLAVARAQAAAAAAVGYPRLRAENDRAWGQLWGSGVDVQGDATLTGQVRASQFVLRASVREGSPWAPSPAGLSSDGYNGHVFWDNETWMFPDVLAFDPGTARSVLRYRVDRLRAAFEYARDSGFQGARFPWESGLSGGEETPSFATTGKFEQHISSDVALAMWQYWLATGDRAWLRTDGYPVLKGIADFWAGRVRANDDGSFSIVGVTPPDEHHENITDSVYTNVAARDALRFAGQAAGLVGETADPRWERVAAGLRVPLVDGVHPEFEGYKGDTVKQADVVMLAYPWENPQSAEVTRADLGFYVPRTDPAGPAMTDSVHSILTSQLNEPGCAAFTFTRRSVDPFMRAPFDQFAEARDGGAFTFLTGAGGFLQEFVYGYSGMRLRDSAVVVDPSLPPQLSGVALHRLTWRGRVFDVAIHRDRTTVTSVSGPALPLSVRGQSQTVQPGATVSLDTRRPDDQATTDLARCRPATATSQDPSAPAIAAVDGSPLTSWQPAAEPASLRVDLGHARSLAELTATWDKTTRYQVAVSTDGRSWRTVADTSDATVVLHGVTARHVRVTVATSSARLAELAVR